MKVFLAGIIQGSLRSLEVHGQDWREVAAAAFARHVPEADVYDHFAAHPQGISYDLAAIRRTIEEGNEAARTSDVVVAWVPEASMGTALEIYLAFKAGAVVLAVSPMAANWVLRAYTHRIFPDLEALARFLETGGLRALRTQVQGG